MRKNTVSQSILPVHTTGAMKLIMAFLVGAALVCACLYGANTAYAGPFSMSDADAATEESNSDLLALANPDSEAAQQARANAQKSDFEKAKWQLDDINIIGVDNATLQEAKAYVKLLGLGDMLEFNNDGSLTTTFTGLNGTSKDFKGTWTLTSSKTADILFSNALLDLKLKASISNNKLIIRAPENLGLFVQLIYAPVK
ncbi:MAG: hypothetical protein IKE43_00425 [Coriobacteriales bacterium]|nr:hypothetical protein [Coriobacteriales bacterium]